MAGERVSERARERSEWLGAASGQVAVELIVLLSHSVSPSPRHSVRRPTNVDTLFPYTLYHTLRDRCTLSLRLLQILIHRRKIFSRKIWVPVHTLHVNPFRHFRQRNWRTRCSRYVPCQSQILFTIPTITKGAVIECICDKKIPFTSPTLIINSVAKPPSKPRSHGGDFSGNAPGTGLFTLDDQHAPVELLITLANTAGSKPSRCPRSMASATTICSTPSIKLLHIFAASPDPAGPQ